MKRTILRVVALLLISTSALATSPSKNVAVVIYGSKHVFTVMTPKGWVLDREVAKQIGLPSFFYPEGAQDKTKVHIYAAGYDKESPSDSLNDFITADIKNMKTNYPQLKYTKRNFKVKGSLTSAEMYVFTNMKGFYKENVIFIETKDSIITIVFSTKNKADYDKYLNDFYYLAESFVFLTNNPDEMYKAAEKAGVKLE